MVSVRLNLTFNGGGSRSVELQAGKSFSRRGTRVRGVWMAWERLGVHVDCRVHEHMQPVGTALGTRELPLRGCELQVWGAFTLILSRFPGRCAFSL